MYETTLLTITEIKRNTNALDFLYNMRFYKIEISVQATERSLLKICSRV